jgi:hypothetical protein
METKRRGEGGDQFDQKGGTPTLSCAAAPPLHHESLLAILVPLCCPPSSRASRKKRRSHVREIILEIPLGAGKIIPCRVLGLSCASIVCLPSSEQVTSSILAAPMQHHAFSRIVICTAKKWDFVYRAALHSTGQQKRYMYPQLLTRNLGIHLAEEHSQKPFPSPQSQPPSDR